MMMYAAVFAISRVAVPFNHMCGNKRVFTAEKSLCKIKILHYILCRGWCEHINSIAAMCTFHINDEKANTEKL